MTGTLHPARGGPGGLFRVYEAPKDADDGDQFHVVLESPFRDAGLIDEGTVAAGRVGEWLLDRCDW